MSIAVIIPAFNAAKFLESAIRSVVAQTLPADEILVIDDGSTDNTAAIAESFGEPVRLFCRRNEGQAASRNFAATQTQAEWLAFLDADDLWHPMKLKRQMAAIAAHPEADCCYCGQVNFEQDDAGFYIKRAFPAPPAADIRRTLFEGDIFLPSATLIRRTAFLALGGFSTEYKIGEDWDLWLRLYHSGAKFIDCPGWLFEYRLHAHNSSKDYGACLSNQLAIYNSAILPHYPAQVRWLKYLRYHGRRTGEAAYGLREMNAPGYLPMMIRSILYWPLGDFRRHKVLVHMILTRLGLLSAPGPRNADPLNRVP